MHTETVSGNPADPAGKRASLPGAALVIGAGGLGSLMFEGLFSSAQDLVLLGVVPIVVLGALVDGVFKLLIRLTRPVTTRKELSRRDLH